MSTHPAARAPTAHMPDHTTPTLRDRIVQALTTHALAASGQTSRLGMELLPEHVRAKVAANASARADAVMDAIANRSGTDPAAAAPTRPHWAWTRCRCCTVLRAPTPPT